LSIVIVRVYTADSHRREEALPISLDDAELAVIKTCATPLRPWQRDRFLKTVARELERHSGELGPGVISRIARSAQQQILNGGSAALERAAAKFRRRID
jgi:hypothetical protein